ncbi:MAG: hypothetical protein ACRDQ0_19375 [Pseudonocardia sp.]
MAYAWVTLTIPITGIDGLAHHRAGPDDRPPALGRIPTACGKLIAPASIAAPIGRNCPDCHPPRNRPERPPRWWRRPTRAS